MLLKNVGWKSLKPEPRRKQSQSQVKKGYQWSNYTLQHATKFNQKMKYQSILLNVLHLRNFQRKTKKKKKLTEEISSAAKAANTTRRSSDMSSHIRPNASKIVTGFAVSVTSTWSVESRHQLPPGNISINLLRWSLNFTSLSLKTSF